MEEIYNNGGKDYIIYVESNVIEMQKNMKCNNIQLETVIKTLLNSEPRIKHMQFMRSGNNVTLYETMRRFIVGNYSWDNVAHLLYDYFKYIVT